MKLNLATTVLHAASTVYPLFLSLLFFNLLNILKQLYHLQTFIFQRFYSNLLNLFGFLTLLYHLIKMAQVNIKPAIPLYKFTLIKFNLEAFWQWSSCLFKIVYKKMGNCFGDPQKKVPNYQANSQQKQNQQYQNKIQKTSKMCQNYYQIKIQPPISSQELILNVNEKQAKLQVKNQKSKKQDADQQGAKRQVKQMKMEAKERCDQLMQKENDQRIKREQQIVRTELAEQNQIAERRRRQDKELLLRLQRLQEERKRREKNRQQQTNRFGGLTFDNQMHPIIKLSPGLGLDIKSGAVSFSFF